MRPPLLTGWLVGTIVDHVHDLQSAAMSVLRRRRHKRLRGEFAASRRRLEARARKALRAQRSAIGRSPSKPSKLSGADSVAKDLRGLARELSGSAGGDAQVQAAARGVSALARAYADIAAASRTREMEAAGKITKRSLAALAVAERERRKAGDAWPL